MLNLTLLQKNAVIALWDLISQGAPEDIIREEESKVLAILPKPIFDQVYMLIAGDTSVRGTIFYIVAPDYSLAFDSRFDTEVFNCRLPKGAIVCGHIDHYSGVVVTPPAMDLAERTMLLEVLEKALLKVRFSFMGTPEEVLAKRLVSFFD